MDNIFKINNISNRVNDIFKKRFNINLKTLCENYETENLLGNKFGLEPKDLVYLFFEIEREFGIKIPQEDICNNGFSTIQRITDIILSQTNKVV